MRIYEHELKTRATLANARVDAPGICARVLTALACGLDRNNYAASSGMEMREEAVALLERLARRRAAGEPLAYILGKREFYLHEFIVSPATLIPRPETELLVETALGLFPPKNLVFADIGCGCGCIGLSLLAQRPMWQGFLLDRSTEALDIARANMHTLSLAAPLLTGDIFSLPFARESMDLIVANPPYVAQDEPVMDEVLAYEPHEALFSANNGFAHLEAILDQARSLLRPGGWLLMEHGASQGDGIMARLEAAGYEDMHDYKDMAGLPRCCAARKRMAS